MNTFDRIAAMIRDEFDSPAVLLPENTLAELGADSLGVMEIAFQIEEEFAVNLPDDLARDDITLGYLAEAVEKLMGEKQ